MLTLETLVPAPMQQAALAVLTWASKVRPANRRSTAYRSEAEPAVLGGSGRCGTTLLRVMLDSHPAFCCGPESDLFFDKPIWPRRLARHFDLERQEILALRRQAGSRAEFIDLFFRRYAERRGKRRWAEKSPDNLLHLDFIRATFPRSRFLHILRDGRDVACSFRTHPRHVVRRGRLVPTHNWHPLAWCIGKWVTAVERSRQYRGEPWYRELRYEDLVARPEEALRPVLEFLGEEWDDRVLRFDQIRDGSRDATRFPANVEAAGPLRSGAAGRWRTDMSDEDKRLFKRLAGGLLVELGYETSDDW